MILDQLNNYLEEMTGSLRISERPEQHDKSYEEEHNDEDVNAGSPYDLEIAGGDKDEFLNDDDLRSNDHAPDNNSFKVNFNPADKNGED